MDAKFYNNVKIGAPLRWIDKVQNDLINNDFDGIWNDGEGHDRLGAYC